MTLKKSDTIVQINLCAPSTTLSQTPIYCNLSWCFIAMFGDEGNRDCHFLSKYLTWKGEWYGFFCTMFMYCQPRALSPLFFKTFSTAATYSDPYQHPLFFWSLCEFSCLYSYICMTCLSPSLWFFWPSPWGLRCRASLNVPDTQSKKPFPDHFT